MFTSPCVMSKAVLRDAINEDETSSLRSEDLRSSSVYTPCHNLYYLQRRYGLCKNLRLETFTSACDMSMSYEMSYIADETGSLKT